MIDGAEAEAVVARDAALVGVAQTPPPGEDEPVGLAAGDELDAGPLSIVGGVHKFLADVISRTY